MQLKVEKFHFKLDLRDFPGGLAAKTLKSQYRGLGSIPGQGTRYHMPQLRWKIQVAQLKTWCSQRNIFKKKTKTKTRFARKTGILWKSLSPAHLEDIVKIHKLVHWFPRRVKVSGQTGR